MLAFGDFMQFQASGLNALLSFGVVFRISRFHDGPLSRDVLLENWGSCAGAAGPMQGSSQAWKVS